MSLEITFEGFNIRHCIVSPCSSLLSDHCFLSQTKVERDIPSIIQSLRMGPSDLMYSCNGTLTNRSLSELGSSCAATWVRRFATAARLRRSMGPIGCSTIPYDSGALHNQYRRHHMASRVTHMRAGRMNGRRTVRAIIGVRSSSYASGYLI